MIDSHAHLTDERFAGDLGDVVDRARAEGVHTIVTVATDLVDTRAAIGLSATVPGVYATAGIHPHSASSASAEAWAEVRDLAAGPRVVAIGETGLDYHYDFAPRPAQRAAFERQLRLGSELGLPVVVHSREADADLISMISEHGRSVVGVLHSFSSGSDLLDLALEIGWYVSFAGMITFKNFQGHELVRAVPRDRLLVETDCPYLTPVPHRGKRNEPAYVPLIAARAAEIRGESATVLVDATILNAGRFYSLPSAAAAPQRASD